MFSMKNDEDSAELSYDTECQAVLRLERVDSMDHATAFGRIAFAVETEMLPKIQETVEKSGNKIITPLLKLDTPGKATVQVVILADPVSCR